MGREVEVKFSDIDFERLRTILTAGGAERIGRSFEENVVFDTPERKLKQAEMLLRLRRAWGICKVTLKTPPDGEVPEGFKVWTEHESQVGDFDAFLVIFASLGYPEAFRYEKVREKWKIAGTVVCFDTLPFGDFLEIEGEETDIRRAAELLGLDMGSADIRTYHDLHQAFRKTHGLPPQLSFTFSPERRQALEKKCTEI